MKFREKRKMLSSAIMSAKTNYPAKNPADASKYDSHNYYHCQIQGIIRNKCRQTLRCRKKFPPYSVHESGVNVIDANDRPERNEEKRSITFIDHSGVRCY